MSQQPPWSQGQPYPSGQPYPPGQQPYPPVGPGQGYGYAPAPAAAVRTSVKGPRAMTIVGAGLLVLAVVLLALALPTIFSSVPTHVVDGDGNAGSAAVATLKAPGSTQVHLEEGYYDVFLAARGATPRLGGSVHIAAADGSTVRVTAPEVDRSLTINDTTVVSVASFHVSRSGEYQVDAPQVSPRTAHAFVVHGMEPGTVAAAGLELGAAFLVGLAGLGLTIGGGVWWGARSRNRKRVAAWQAPSPWNYGTGLPPR